MKKTVILTGAGISAESGLKTFRGQGGLWEGEPISQVATPEAFYRSPQKVHRFYNLRRAQLQNPEIVPNPAHMALAMLERKFTNDIIIVTQNVDNLHEQAGSKKVIHMHGELNRIRCIETGKTYPWTEDLDEETPHPEGLKGRLRPDIVWFGESPKAMGEIQSHLERAELFISIGTSGAVYPAAQFVTWVSPSCETVEFNLGDTEISHLFQKAIVGPASETIPKYFEKLISN